MANPNFNPFMLLKTTNSLKNNVKSVKIHLGVLADTEVGRMTVGYDLLIEVPEEFRHESADYLFIFLSGLNWRVTEATIVDQEIDDGE